MTASTSPLVTCPPLVIGWREWVHLSDLGIDMIKAKIDTGARSSSLHAVDIKPLKKHGVDWVRFRVPPIQRHDGKTIDCEVEVHDQRTVRSSSGQLSQRYVIQTTIHWMGHVWLADLTLADRTEMGFRMLIGREALRGSVLVDSGRSYLGGHRRKSLQWVRKAMSQKSASQKLTSHKTTSKKSTK